MSIQLTHESQLLSQEGNKTSNYLNYTASPALPAIVLGGGYSSDRQMATFVKCLNNGSITSNGEAKSSVLFGDSRSFSEFESDLDIDVSTSSSRNLFSVDASASYGKSMKDTDYTQSFYFTYKINFPTQIFNPSGYETDALNAIGKGVYHEGIDRFREVCGDQYIQQVILGAGLYVTMKIFFGSKSVKNQFAAHLGVGFGNIFDVSNKISKIVNQTTLNGNRGIRPIHVKIYG